jgi:hypothetical protein
VCSAGTYEQNRWSVVAQALAGEFSPYECSAQTRIGGIYTGQYDEGYFLPHIQLPQEIATYAGSQSTNGVLDIYLERIKFGLMTTLFIPRRPHDVHAQQWRAIGLGAGRRPGERWCGQHGVDDLHQRRDSGNGFG